MRTLPVGLLLLVAAANPADAGFTAHLDPVEAAVRERSLTIVVVDRATQRQAKAAERALTRLTRVSESPRDDLRHLSMAARLLDRAFPADPTLGPLLDGALGALTADVGRTRDTLQRLATRLGSERLDRKIAKGVEGADRLVAKAASLTDRSRRGRVLSQARNRLSKARVAVERGLGTVDAALYIGGSSNLPEVSYVPLRQSGEEFPIPLPPGDVRSEFSDSMVDSGGTFLLTVRYRSAGGGSLPTEVDVSFFRLSGPDHAVLGWTRSTTGQQLAEQGLLLRQTQSGVELVFEDFAMEPTRSAVNTAKGGLTLSGTLPLHLQPQ